MFAPILVIQGPNRAKASFGWMSMIAPLKGGMLIKSVYLPHTVRSALQRMVGIDTIRPVEDRYLRIKIAPCPRADSKVWRKLIPVDIDYVRNVTRSSEPPLYRVFPVGDLPEETIHICPEVIDEFGLRNVACLYISVEVHQVDEAYVRMLRSMSPEITIMVGGLEEKFLQDEFLNERLGQAYALTHKEFPDEQLGNPDFD